MLYSIAMFLKNDHIALSNFEGPLDFLLCLLQRDEIEICDVPIYELIQQCICLLHQKSEGLEKRGRADRHRVLFGLVKKQILIAIY